MINQQRLVNTFLDLVKIDSPSGSEETIAKEVAKRLTHLGGNVTFDDYGNVIAKFDGQGEPFLLSSHLDTVEPGRGIKPIVDGDIIKSDGSTILGGDAKAGVAIILETLHSLKEDTLTHAPIEVALTLGEELGLLGAQNLDYAKLRAKKGLVLDGENDASTVDIAAPGYLTVDATIVGRGAHAGVEPEKGISAIKIASEIIAKLKLGRIDKETTANIGLIEGGSARNAIPETAHFKGEIRSRDIKKMEKHTKHFQTIINTTMKKYPHAKLDLKLNVEFHPYIFEKTHPLIQTITKALKSLHVTPNLHQAGGGSDANVFHKHGIETIVVGTGDFNPHTTREYVSIAQMMLAANLCQKLLTK